MKQQFKMSSPKFELLFRRMRFKVFHSGRGTAKSWSIALAIVYYMHRCKVRVLSCRYFQNSIKDSNKKLIEDTIERLGLSDEFIINNDSIVNKVTGSECIFKGLYNNLASLKSIEGIGICVIDEAENITDDAWNFLIPTIRSKNSEVWISFNPRFVSDPTWKRFVLNPPKNSEVVKLELSDNPFISDDILIDSEHMKATDPDMWNFVYGGEPLGNAEMTLIPQLLITKSRSNIVTMSPNSAIIAGLDVSGLGSDKTQLIRRQGSRILSVDTLGKGDTIQTANWVKEIYNARPWEKLVVDASGSTGVYDNLAEWSRLHGQFKTFKFIGGSKSRKPKLYFNLRTECFVLMRDWMNTGRITNHAEFDEIAQLKYTFVGRDIVKLDSKKTLKKSPDLADSLSMTFYVSDDKQEDEAEKPRIFDMHSNQKTWAG